MNLFYGNKNNFNSTLTQLPKVLEKNSTQIYNELLLDQISDYYKVGTIFTKYQILRAKWKSWDGTHNMRKLAQVGRPEMMDASLSLDL